MDAECTGVRIGTTRNVWLAAALLGLAACTSQPTSPRVADVGAAEARAREAEAGGDLARAAALYEQLGGSVTGTARAGYLIEAARLAADLGDAAAARRRLNDARPSADREQSQAIAVLAARLELDQGRPQAALETLAAIQPPVGVPVLRDAAAVRGQALFALGRHVDAVRALVEREVWLDDADQVLANQRMIWEGFRQYPPPATLAPSGDRVVDGWLALAPLAPTSDDAELRRALLAWRETFTDHPAAGGLLAELLALQRVGGFPSQVALLLPLTSAARQPALALRDGFMAARLADVTNETTTVRVYDTAALGSREAYLRAQLDGADFIVGPLLRAEVDEVIAQAGFVPTLALNYSQSDTPYLGSFYQFALAPEDEARAAARSAAAAGATTAIALVPSNDRGYRLLNAFRAEFESLGGTLLDFSGYDPALQDFSAPIAALLNVTRSAQRHRRLAANLGMAVQFEPRRRQDVDAIFLGADARAGRLLMPQLRFNFAGAIPTFATADIFDPGSSGRDNDLNGVIFHDAPLVVAPDSAGAELAASLRNYWPQRAGQSRLYGMGYDAYALAGALYSSSGRWPMAGVTGYLVLGADGRVHRNLPVAQFRNGRPIAIAPALPVAPSTSELVGSR
jgi:outer membrane PBP1 activator LpoA protein